MKLAADHGFPVDADGDDDTALDAFKNERDYIAQSVRLKTTVAAMDWAIEEIERLQRNLNSRDDFLGEIGQWQAFVDQLPK